MMMKKIVVPALILAVAAGCSGGAGKQADVKSAEQAAVEDTTPVTLKLFIGVPIVDKDIETLIIEPVKKKYPYISIEVVRSGKGTTIAELVAAGQSPDLLYSWNGGLPVYKEFDLLYDLTPLAKKAKTDLARFEPTIIDSLKAISDKGELYALPFSEDLSALFYNKDIFDRTGVPYPKDGMTWEDAAEIARKLSFVERGVQYRGLDMETIMRLRGAFGITYIDAKTEKASINTDLWRKVFETAKAVYAVPNNKPANLLAYGSKPAFLKDQTLAMIATNNMLNQGLEDAGKKGLQWDIAQYPSFKEKPNVSGHVAAHLVAITKTSKYKEQAMKVLETVTSDEVQTISARTTARISSLKNTVIKKQLGADMPFLQGKHVEAFFKSTAIPSPIYSQYEEINTDAYKIVMQSFKDYFEFKDVNTALREAEEKINQFLDGKRK
ncbi:extracellular solute-binding protein [Paenibacillus mesophilus]|uniref:ABC transporter substrate-binding protein n=1 Tax=Paenibacillus mesophilus TaxID=2582849 RepID=UPI00110D8D98|nr:extracellular solute-binding protein [Paenibacillus mesophilus]TMV46871.1 extracellular solute-binding protein [Paenibacillus mesophilus]